MADPKDQKTQIAPIDIAKGTPGPALGPQQGGRADGAHGGGQGSTLPPPPAPPPRNPGLAGQATIMLDAQALPAPAPRAAEPRRAYVPPVPRREVAWARWVAGPLLAVATAALTLVVCHFAWPHEPLADPTKKKVGRLRLQSDPQAASITVDGTPYAHFTPTTIEEEVGKRVRLRFSHDGYAPKEEEVVIRDTEISFRIKLDRLEQPPEPAPPPPEPQVAKKRRPVAPAPAPVPTAGRGRVSVYVRPWAIVYIDGSRVRQTPLMGHEIPAGRHTLELVNEERNRREKIPIQVQDGESQEIRRDWDKN